MSSSQRHLALAIINFNSDSFKPSETPRSEIAQLNLKKNDLIGADKKYSKSFLTSNVASQWLKYFVLQHTIDV